MKDEAIPPLTLRRQQIACLIAQGLTNREIAQRLGISVFTVRNHVSSLLKKLRVTNRAQVACLMGQHENTHQENDFV
jgi:DNA-binding NarL/FixJ family response regulator